MFSRSEISFSLLTAPCELLAGSAGGMPGRRALLLGAICCLRAGAEPQATGPTLGAEASAVDTALVGDASAIVTRLSGNRTMRHAVLSALLADATEYTGANPADEDAVVTLLELERRRELSASGSGSTSNSSSGSGSGSGSYHAAPGPACNRETAVWGIGGDASDHSHGHHNYQLVILGTTLTLIGGGLIQHGSEVLNIPLPYTMLLLLFGSVLGLWVLFNPDYTLQPGMVAGSRSWPSPGGTRTLQCNVTEYLPNDLYYNGWHLGNSLRLLAEMDPHLLLHVPRAREPHRTRPPLAPFTPLGPSLRSPPSRRWVALIRQPAPPARLQVLLPPLLFESAFAIDWHIFSKVSLQVLVLAAP